MKTKLRYSLIVGIILIFSTMLQNIMTNSKYFSSIDMENNVSVGVMVFEFSKVQNEIQTYTLNSGSEIIVPYKLSNKNANNVINRMDLKYYLKILDENNNDLPLYISVDGYNKVEGKGFGEINLAYDGVTEETKDIIVRVKCPEDYNSVENLKCRVKLIAEGISNPSVLLEETSEFNIHIDKVQQVEKDNQESISELENDNNEIKNILNEENMILETQKELGNEKNEILNQEVTDKEVSNDVTDEPKTDVSNEENMTNEITDIYNSESDNSKEVTEEIKEDEKLDSEITLPEKVEEISNDEVDSQVDTKEQ